MNTITKENIKEAVGMYLALALFVALAIVTIVITAPIQ